MHGPAITVSTASTSPFPWLRVLLHLEGCTSVRLPLQAIDFRGIERKVRLKRASRRGLPRGIREGQSIDGFRLALTALFVNR